MKAIKSVVLLLLSFASVTALANNAMPEQLIGKWSYAGENGGYPEVATFRKDGSYLVEGILTQSVGREWRACMVTIDGTMAFASNGKDQYAMTTTSAHLTYVQALPGTTPAACHVMVDGLNQNFSMADDITVLAAFTKIKMHELTGHDATFTRIG